MKTLKPNMKSLVFDALMLSYLSCVFVVVVLGLTNDDLLDLNRNASWVLRSFVIGGLVSWGLNRLGILTLGLSIFEASHAKSKREPVSLFKTFWGWQLVVTFVVTFVVGAFVTDFDPLKLLDEQGFLGAKRIFFALLNPDWTVMPRGILAIIETVFMAFMATVLAVPIAFLLAFFCARNLMNGNSFQMSVYHVLRSGLNITRSIEPLIWAIIFSVWVEIGPFAGMLALMFHSVASLTKQYSEIIECVSDHPIEGVRATGANPVQVIWYAVVPQVVLPYISFTLYRWDINVRMATVIGLVGAGGIGTLLMQYQGQMEWSAVGTLALLIIFVVWAMDSASGLIRAALK